MATRRVSPGGALLRTSRMFSLPAPIPPPPNDATLGSHFSSDTMTLQYPTHQVITTLSAPRKQGDWGLKRPLPLKSTTKSSKPLLRVKAIDSIEQVTDYTSGHDHAMTLRKFQQLGLPITLRQPGEAGKTHLAGKVSLPSQSVFENAVDITAIDPRKRAELSDHRWKFSGPWLAGMTEGKFKEWVVKEVRPKRAAFRQFLKKKLASEMNEAATLAAVEKGEEPPASINPRSISEEQLIEYLRRLRYNHQLLYDMVGQFLDLAPLRPSMGAQEGLANFKNQGSIMEYREVKSPWADYGPPVTHPSAGISYLRTSMYMDNHPIYGPQKHHQPVLARVIRPIRAATNQPAKLGVAGFVVDSPAGDNALNSKTGNALTKLDPSVEGGAKLWVQAHRASVDESGRVLMGVTEAWAEATLVAQELLGEKACLGSALIQSQLQNQQESATEIRRRYSAAAPTMSSAADYGLLK
ncbi:hypothetical protein MFIFM68171_06805 [Madurella fahalii]|uniref:Uncharacterized protein n=1 Tax=Madurella fahalii TaxID=1157608 RepID=A0ABQ0GFQ5_9PEZI